MLNLKKDRNFMKPLSGQGNVKSVSQLREEKIINHLCKIAEEPSENQTKFLEHIVHRLASPSSKIRLHAAALLNKTLKFWCKIEQILYFFVSDDVDSLKL